MVSTGPNYGKLKTHLQLAMCRFQLLRKKKTELVQKARKEIADYIANGKYERAKIRIEHIIREDYLVEAMEFLEMFCDLLLARFGLIQQMKDLDEGLAEAVSSLIWAAPRLQTDVAELKPIADQLTYKYGKIYAQAVKKNELNSVSKQLIQKLSVQAPPKILVGKYLIEIAKSHNVNYEPNLEILAPEESAAGALTANDLIDLDDKDSKTSNPGVFIGEPSLELEVCPGVQYPQSFLQKSFNYPPPNEFAHMNKGSALQQPPSASSYVNWKPDINPDAIELNIDTPALTYGNPPPNEFAHMNKGSALQQPPSAPSYVNWKPDINPDAIGLNIDTAALTYGNSPPNEFAHMNKGSALQQPPSAPSYVNWKPGINLDAIGLNIDTPALPDENPPPYEFAHMNKGSALQQPPTVASYVTLKPDINPYAIGFNRDTPALPDESAIRKQSPFYYASKASSDDKKPTSGSQENFPTYTLPELPSVPDTLPGLDGEDGSDKEFDLDDLAKRFEDLKRR